MRWWMGCGVFVCAVAATALGGITPSQRAALDEFQAANPGVLAYREGAVVTRVYGTTFGYGGSPEQTADSFVQEHAAMLGAETGDLVPGNQFNDVLTQPLGYNPETGTYKFTLVYYSQYRNGIPVFRADLRLLVLNAEGYPLVWVGNNLGELGTFSPPAGPATPQRGDVGHAAALAAAPDLVEFSPSQTVIWAGVNHVSAEPRLAYTFVGDNGLTAPEDVQKWLFVADADTGAILYREDLIYQTNVTGSVHGMATTGDKADACNPEVDTPMPYARVSIGSNITYADANGNFTITNSGSSQVTVSSPMRGQYFRIYDQGGNSLDDQTKSVTPPGPANFVHNSANTSEVVRAQVNCYIQANKVRDFALTQNPSYPVIAGQTSFPVNVNIASTCNAYYDGSSINFYHSGGGCNNTGYSSVVHHEYGHHLVASGGSGQGAYGEGMGDCMAMLIADDSVLGWGFQTCSSGIRNANNTLQYPCSGEIHYCGQLISGCVWSTRTALQATNPSTYLSIISNLTVDSILLHGNVQTITPAITVDFLTLDDDDGNLQNLTPHYNEICNGFGAHNMDCPHGLAVTPDADLNSSGSPGGPFVPPYQTYVLRNLGPTAFDYQVTNTQSWVTLTNASGTIQGGGQVSVTATINATADALPLGTYTDTVTFRNTTDGSGNDTHAVSLRVGGPHKIYGWNFDTDPGWSGQGDWAWGTPTGGSGTTGYPDPTAGYDGPKVVGYNLNGGYANNLTQKHLYATPVDCSQLSEVSLRFYRWLGVGAGDSASIFISTDGVLWLQIWKNSGKIDDGAWTYQNIDVSSYADGHATVYFRWTMGATYTGLTYCGWNLDDVEIFGTSSCVAPAVITQPGSQSVCDGDPASFSVSATGSTPLTYQWRKNGTNISGATNSSYSIGAVGSGDAASYDCVVTNACGSVASNAAPLTVAAGADITTQPQSQSVCAGDSVTFTVAATGSGTLAYQWRKNGADIGGANDSSLTIHPVDAGHVGSYDCVVSNDCGSVTSNAATLSVNAGPAITTDPTSQATHVGGSVTFNVVATGSGTLGYQWRFNGSDLDGATENALLLDPVTPASAGAYDCVVTNDCGSATSAAATLTVWPAGDMNCDGVVNNQDIDGFVQALFDPAGYSLSHPSCDLLNGDITGDGVVNNQDIDGFVAILFANG